MFKERRDIGIRSKVRQADQQYGDQPDPCLWVDKQSWQVTDLNGFLRSESRQQEDLRQQHRNAHQRRDQEGHPPAHQAAEPGTHRHAQNGGQGHAHHDDRGGLCYAHALGRQPPAEGNGRGPEAADADAEQYAAEQQQAEIISKGHHQVGDDHYQCQADQQVTTVHGANADRQKRRGEGSHDAGQCHHQSGVTGTDAQIAGDVVEYAHR